MKLYKFRQLETQTDLDRAKRILTTGKFWCSRFWELNDPMEGIYWTRNTEISSWIFNQKQKYVICSLSSQRAFTNPAMWGYYANAFKGIAIEIDVPRVQIKKVAYTNTLPQIDHPPISENIETVLTTKLKHWIHEAEYRFLTSSDENEHEIGTIKAIYLGDPYGDISNQDDIERNSPSLQCYSCLARQLVQSIRGIKFHSVKIESGKVVKGQIIKPSSTSTA